MPNKWVEHVKQWSAENNMTYGCAVSKPECREAYHKKNLTKKYEKEQQPKEMEQMGKEDINRTKKPEKEKGQQSKEIEQMSKEDINRAMKPEKPKKKQKITLDDGQKLRLENKKINGQAFLVTEKDKYGNRLVIENNDTYGVILGDTDTLYEKGELTKNEGFQVFGKEAYKLYYEGDFL